MADFWYSVLVADTIVIDVFEHAINNTNQQIVISNVELKKKKKKKKNYSSSA